MTDTGPPSLVTYDDEDDMNDEDVEKEENLKESVASTSAPELASDEIDPDKSITTELTKTLSHPTLNGMETSSVDQISDDEDVPSQTNSPITKQSPERKSSVKPPKKKAKIEATLSLVSYGYGDDDEDDDEVDEEESGDEKEDGEAAGDEDVGSDMEVSSGAGVPRTVGGGSNDNSGGQSPRRPSPRDVAASTEEDDDFMDAAIATTNRSSLDQDVASSLSRSVRDLAPNEIKIPPAPNMRCSAALINKVMDAKEKMRLDPNYDINLAIQSNKGFRNPSIYDKIVTFLGIDEKGTNYPPESYNPYVFGKESFYDELAKAQKTEVEKREKERKERGKVDFVPGDGSKKDSTAGTDTRKRSKWDMSPGKKTAQHKTQIPAVGNIMKKK